ncbi:MAG: hypothetical protein EXR76_09530 [Myxococcales bacterium]|nr:hypothetical protein [Myxococcales bacterium]
MKIFEGRGEDTLSPEERRLVEGSRTVFRELDKVLKAIGLYGLEHQGTTRFRAVFRQAVMSTIAGSEDGMNLAVGPYEFTLHDIAVYQNPNPDKNFIYRFFQDGIRTLHIEPGVSDDELDALVDVLLTNWEDPALFEDDAVTLLWSKNFEHITYEVMESFQDAAPADADLKDYTVTGVMERVKEAGGPSGTVNVVGQGRSAPAGADGRAPEAFGSGSMPGGGRGVVDLSAAGVSPEEVDAFVESPFAMDEHEFLVLKRIVETAGDATLEKFVEILFRVALVDDGEALERVTSTIERIVGLLLMSDRVDDLRRVLGKLRALTGPEGELLFENLQTISTLFACIGNADFVDRVILGLETATAERAPVYLYLLRLLEPQSAIHIARAAGRLSPGEKRNAVFDYLAEIIGGSIREVGRLLQNCNAPHAHDLIRILRSIDHPDVVSAINAALQNHDAAVRLEALSNLPADRLNAYLPQLLNASKDRAKIIRNKALHMLARLATPQVHLHLMQRVREKDFIQVELDEKRRFFAAIALTGDPSEYFLGLLDERSFFSRRDDEDHRACAAMGLALRMSAAALPLFEREMKRKLQSDQVREACAWALQHVRQNKEERTRQLYEIFFRGVLSGVAS